MKNQKPFDKRKRLDVAIESGTKRYKENMRWVRHFNLPGKTMLNYTGGRKVEYIRNLEAVNNLVDPEPGMIATYFDNGTYDLLGHHGMKWVTLVFNGKDWIDTDTNVVKVIPAKVPVEEPTNTAERNYVRHNNMWVDLRATDVKLISVDNNPKRVSSIIPKFLRGIGKRLKALI